MKKHSYTKRLLASLLAAALLAGMAPGAYAGLWTGASSSPDISYCQDMSGDALAGPGGESAGFATVGSATGGPAGQALSIQTGGDVRTKLLFFSDTVENGNTTGDATSAEGMANGIYEVSFRTADTVPESIGFLARYKDEANYAGLSINLLSDGTTEWACHYSTGANELLSDQTFGSLSPNTSYQVKITYNGDSMSFAVKEDGNGDYTELDTQALPPEAYTGEGGFAISLNPGAGGGDRLIVDNIRQERLDGTLVRKLDFEDVSDAGEVQHEAWVNNSDDVDNGGVTLELEQMPVLDLAYFASGDRINALPANASGVFLDSGSPVTDTATLSLTLAADGPCGVVFNYVDENNYNTIACDGEGQWSLSGVKDGSPITPVALLPWMPAYATAVPLALEYSPTGNVHVMLGDKDLAVDTVDTLDSYGANTAPGKVGLWVGGNSNPVYASRILTNYATPQSPTDPGLPDVTPGDGMRVYRQDLSSGTSSLADQSGSKQPCVSVNQTDADMVDGFTPGRATKIEGVGIYLDTASPMTAKGVYTVQLNGSTNQYGLVFNYRDEENYSTLYYDGYKWLAGGKKDNASIAVIDLSGYSIPAPVADETRTYRLDTRDHEHYKLTISGGANTTVDDATSYDLGELMGIYKQYGQVGLFTRANMTLYAGPADLVYTLEAVAVPDPTEHFITLASDDMQVLVGDSFPHIYSYKTADGSKSIANGVRPGAENTDMNILPELNGQVLTCATTSELKSKTDNSATYSITATGTGIEATFTVVLSVEGRTLRMEIPEVKQSVGNVRAFSFADQKLVSLAGQGTGAALGRFDGQGAASDVFIELAGQSQPDVYDGPVTYALLYDTVGGSVAAVESNALDGNYKYILTENVGRDPYLALSGRDWAWQYYNELDPMQEEKPYAEVIIGGDENGDGDVTWQDAGIAYREIMQKPSGWEDSKNEWMFIAMNMSSQASQPFIRVLDEAKALSYLTDGFGMKIMNAGYQGAGYKDSQGHYAFVGEQQGGVEDFNYLVDEGLKYGIKNGVSLSATEYALDSFTTVLKNMQGYGGYGLRPGSNWFDQAYLVDPNKDVASGELERRLDELKTAVPNLDFVCVDAYQSGSGYNARQMMKYMNDNGWTVGAEALGDFSQSAAFVQRNTDQYDKTGGTQSEVMRFVTHGLADLGAPDRALLGSLMPGVADWRDANEFSEGQDAFYRNNLPTKYLQHFDLLSWTPNKSATFSDGVETKVTEVNGRFYNSISRNNIEIAVIDVTDVQTSAGNASQPGKAEIFIPWSPETEDKIYCYNDVNDTKTWQVPVSWGASGTAYLYPLTANGRGTPAEVSFTGGYINLNLELGAPYILTKTQADQPHLYSADGSATSNYIPAPTGEYAWGQGSPIKNFGFTGQTLEGWTVTAAEGDASGVAVDLTFPGGDPRASFAKGFAGSLSQTVTGLTPGKTYTFSVWTMSEGGRPVTLRVEAGGTALESSVDTTAGIPVRIKPSKYNGLNYQRLKVDITIPGGVTEASLSFSTKAGDRPVYADDFRCWEWPGTQNPLAQSYYYYEDFENLDENWGPFVSQADSQPYTNLAYKNPQGTQAKYYTLDKPGFKPDDANLTSLRIQQPASAASQVLMRTLPSTLNFETGRTYTVELDYASYREIRYMRTENQANIPSLDLDGNAIPEIYFGYNYPLAQPAYTITVHKADGSVLATHEFKPSSFQEGTQIEDFTYNSRPSTETISFAVDATTEAGIYLTIEANTVGDQTCTLVIDNFRVTAGGPSGGTPPSGGSGITDGQSTTTTKNPDGSTTVTVTDSKTGTVTETTTAPNGLKVETVTSADGSAVSTVTVPKGIQGTVTLPAALPVGGSVEIKTDGPVDLLLPLDNPSPGVVPVLVKPDGTREILKKSVTGEDGVALHLEGGATLELVDNSKSFPDVPKSHWAASAIDFATSRELFSGVGGGNFAPDLPMSRAMLATVLYRLENEPEAGPGSFADVPAGSWYAEAVGWASGKGIITGTGAGFDPDGDISREALVVMLYRFAGAPEVGGTALQEFGDGGDVSDWAQDAMLWALQNGILTGKSGKLLDPSGSASRAEVATMLERFVAKL